MSKLFITLDDIKALRDVSSNIDDNRVNTWVNQVQINEMRSFLGAVLYKLLYDDFDDVTKEFTEPRFTKLFNGDDGGEVIFYGLKPVIALYAYAELVRNNPFNVSRFDNVRLSEDNSEAVALTSATSKASEAQSQALKLLNECEAYLLENKADFPEWVEPVNINRQNATFKYYKVWPK